MIGNLFSCWSRAFPDVVFLPFPVIELYFVLFIPPYSLRKGPNHFVCVRIFNKDTSLKVYILQKHDQLDQFTRTDIWLLSVASKKYQKKRWIFWENIKQRCEKQYLFLNLILLWTLWDNSFRWYSFRWSIPNHQMKDDQTCALCMVMDIECCYCVFR